MILLPGVMPSRPGKRRRGRPTPLPAQEPGGRRKLRGLGGGMGAFPVFGSPPKIGIGGHIKYVK